MKIIKLVSENVKRLTAVEITPDGNLVTVGGKNGAGKSSVLDSIAYALGGDKLVPTEPIRAGALDAKVVVNLGDLIVTRRFHREKFACNCVRTSGDEPHTADCYSRLLGETKSTLAVTNKDGAKYPSPQKMLDGLLGKLTFDPLAFSREDAKKQNEILRQLTSLDFSMLDRTRKESYDRRTMTNKSLVIMEAQLSKMPEHANVPAEPLSIDEVSNAVRKGHELQREAETRNHAVMVLTTDIERLERIRATSAATIRELRRRIEEEEETQAETDGKIDAQTKVRDEAVVVADAAKKAVPDFQALDKEIRAIDATNTQVRENLARAERQKEVDELKTRIKADTAVIDTVDEQKASMLEAAKFPVPGLGLSDDGVTFHDIPLGQASSSEQLRISIAIGLALNPTLKVLLIRNGNLLDEDSLKLVAEQAKEAGAQVWMEFVTSNGDGMTVMMEDGHVRA